MLEMLGVNPDDPTTHAAYHRNQGFDTKVPPFCIKKGPCLGQAHLYADCPTIVDDEDYYAYWREWAHQQERQQQSQWDNYHKCVKNSSGAGASTFYTVCNTKLDASNLDAPPCGSTGLTN